MWKLYTASTHTFEVLDLEHPKVSADILGDIRAGTEVYYDRRWQASERLCAWLLENPGLLKGKRVLVLGCGVGLESLAACALSAHVHLNDLSPVALRLSAAQLERNGLSNYDLLPGPYEALELPPIDLALGSFLIYNKNTRTAMQTLLAKTSVPVWVCNDTMPAFTKLLKQTGRQVEMLVRWEDAVCLALR